MYKGYFQANQSIAGGIAIGFVPIAHGSSKATAFSSPFNSESSFHGRDFDGWDITTDGQPWGFPIFGRLDAPKSAVHPANVFRPHWINCKRKGASDYGYDQALFLVSNLLWHDREAIPEPIGLKIGNWVVTISPCDEYLEVANSIKAVRGVAPTAEVLIKTSDGSKLALERYSDFMNDLVSVFRLVTGNKVDWLYAEASESTTGRAVERFHKDAITGPFSNTFRFRKLPSGMISTIPKLNFEALAGSFFQNDHQVLDRKTLRELINYFVNTCDETSYLEARGLLAATLFDLIVLKYAEIKKAHNIMNERDFERQVFPVLKEAIRNVELPGPSNELRARAREQLRGAFRQSFRKRLDLLTQGLNLPFDDKKSDRVIKIRNELVHQGTYLPEKTDGPWYDQYEIMIWMNLVALCRLTGYEGNLPTLTEGRRLKV